MKFLAYVRGSTEDVDVRNQIFAIQRWAKENGYEIVKIFPDENVSGWKIPPRERKHFKEMLEYAKQHRIKNVVLYSVDRLSRHFWDGLEILRFFEEEGFNIEFTNDPWFSKMPPDMRKVAIALMLWTAEQYAKSVSEKMKTAIARIKADEDSLNIFETKWGMGKQNNPRRRITAETFIKIVKLRKKGYSWQAIASKLRMKNKTTPYMAWKRTKERIIKLQEEGYDLKTIAGHSGVDKKILKEVIK